MAFFGTSYDVKIYGQVGQLLPQFFAVHGNAVAGSREGRMLNPVLPAVTLLSAYSELPSAHFATRLPSAS